jgi:pyruvate dehydrogenase E2 component (dihydrolipoyllysine-residue acetyltransferase)
MGEFRMPSLGADMEAGTLVEWVKHPGDTVKRGDIIAVVDTQKGAIEIEVFEDGVLDRTVVEPGTRVPVGTVLAVVHGAKDKTAPEDKAVTEKAVTDRTSADRPARRRVTPVARKLAAELGVDIDRVQGTGSEGAITREDVERAAAGQKAPTVPAPPAMPAPPAPLAPPAVPTLPAQVFSPVDRSAGMRTVIAAAMARSKREIPHYYLSTTIDMSAALAWLRAENERRPMVDRLLPAALLVKAVGLALRDVPELNGFWIDGRLRQGAGIHVGTAISLRGGGLVAPALHDVDGMDLTTLMRGLQDLVARARSGSLRSSELTDATITVTNLGDRGVDATFGIIYPPQVALVGFGVIAPRPWIGPSGHVEARSVVTATLSADHRATDGHRGGLFLTALNNWLQTPEKL